MKLKLFGRVWEFKNSTSETPRLNNDEAWAAYLGGRGYPVSASTALKVATVIRCVDVVAKTIASLPLNLYEKTADGGRRKAENLPLYEILHRLPNPETTAYEFWHMYIFNLMLTRGAYAKISRSKSGFITGLYNIPTCKVVYEGRNTINGERFIDVNTNAGKASRLHEGEFMYTPGLRFGDEDDPENPIRIASEVLGLTMALNGFAKDFFEEGTNLGGFVEYDGVVSDKAWERFKDSWEKTYSGVTKQHKWAFLESGFKLAPLGQKPNDSQALESRKFQIIEICRMFGVPPHKVFDLERATFSNIEQQNTEYVQESISPMSVRIEQTIHKDLLATAERTRYYAKFNANALLRGDTTTRTAYYHAMRQDGIMNADEIRQLEDMNDIPGGLGKIYCVNGNMIPLDTVPQNLPKGAKANG